MASVTSIISVFVLLGGLVAAAILLRRYRDQLNTAFVKGPLSIKSVANLGDGSRVILIEVDGQQALCGVGRHGVGAITLLPRSPHQGVPS